MVDTDLPETLSMPTQPAISVRMISLNGRCPNVAAIEQIGGAHAITVATSSCLVGQQIRALGAGARLEVVTARQPVGGDHPEGFSAALE